MSTSMLGRTVLVTGATSGIGYETAGQLAEAGATVLLHGPSATQAQDAALRLAATRGIDSARLRPYGADFTLLDEVVLLAEAVRLRHSSLDVLVNNAAVMAPAHRSVTHDGNEVTFQVNFLAHYLLTTLLEPALANGRVVNVSSELHRGGSIHWDDPNREHDYFQSAVYAQSQLALTMFTFDPGVTAVSVDPGPCVTRLLPLYGQTGAPAAEGARNVVRLCDPTMEVINGDYFDRTHLADPAFGATRNHAVSRLTRLADQLVGLAA